MNYTTLVDDIVARLSPLTDDDIEVQRLPETEAEFSQAFEAPRVTVAYKKSQFGEENQRALPSMVSSDVFVANEYAEVHVMYQSRLLYDEATGIYAVTLAAKKLLYGFAPSDWGRLFPRDFEIQQNAEGVWLAVMVFTCVARAVQYLADDAGEVQPGLETIVFETTITT